MHRSSWFSLALVAVVASAIPHSAFATGFASQHDFHRPRKATPKADEGVVPPTQQPCNELPNSLAALARAVSTAQNAADRQDARNAYIEAKYCVRVMECQCLSDEVSILKDGKMLGTVKGNMMTQMSLQLLDAEVGKLIKPCVSNAAPSASGGIPKVGRTTPR